ncbi:hypothetical protein IQ273_02235 [Nodosilinea sp. LEGE 07298]|uniref:hypothetical protein n=1 Tax=Nodosilinea sp. LEGE 07298 TaxID=2777970 RepID=UPI001880840D|nr:hypothetical protein [Nodosilinea sp. LEGE 07298]MBE9108240.1 hypothetical protein [Nodosilinea sp. LEGE 07298]
MNPLQQLSNLVSLMVSLLVIVWFGAACFKAGWYAHDQPVLNPIFSKLLSVDQKEE